MEHALTWFPLLGTFIWLAWAGWNEYQKVQTYEAWATGAERSKYDIRAVLAQRGTTLTWGKPTRQGPIDLTSVALENIDTITLHINGAPAPANTFVKRGQRIELALIDRQGTTHRVPFIEFPMAQQWKKALQESLQALKSASS
ncbi:hypothetical protein [Leptolyngbya sp. BL0902]|uniref:hypothetical protein n=1 Tax=Leptolyngbya sp. BL0902 TaxID=1115757 RepID=UPI0018E86484|nr:hypothetical protein [Leptolyngbya sp. BL0902]